MTYIYNNNDVCQMIGTVNGGALLISMNTHIPTRARARDKLH
jgi:hypothetical protein